MDNDELITIEILENDNIEQPTISLLDNKCRHTSRRFRLNLSRKDLKRIFKIDNYKNFSKMFKISKNNASENDICRLDYSKYKSKEDISSTDDNSACCYKSTESLKSNSSCNCEIDKDCDCSESENEKLIRKTFYCLYRLKQRCSGLIYGSVDGMATGYYIGMKWGGGGGWIVGSIAQICGMIVCPICAGVGAAIIGAFTDRISLTQLIKDYRYSFGAGGQPPVHGMFS